jgi:hypothetical protein
MAGGSGSGSVNAREWEVSTEQNLKGKGSRGGTSRRSLQDDLQQGRQFRVSGCEPHTEHKPTEDVPWRAS